MTRALALTARQAQALLKAAERENAVVEVKIGTTLVRLIPACRAQEIAPVDEPKEWHF